MTWLVVGWSKISSCHGGGTTCKNNPVTCCYGQTHKHYENTTKAWNIQQNGAWNCPCDSRALFTISPPPPKLDGWNWRELAQLECSKYQAWPNLWSIPNPYLPVSFQPSPQSLDTNLGEAATHGTWLYVLAQKGCILYLFQRVQHVYMIMQRYAKYVQMMGMSMRFAGEPGNRTVFINRCSLSVILCKSVKLGISSALRNQKPIACSFSFPRFF